MDLCKKDLSILIKNLPKNCLNLWLKFGPLLPLDLFLYTPLDIVVGEVEAIFKFQFLNRNYFIVKMCSVSVS